MGKYNYLIINKPYDVLSQFTDKFGRKTLNKFYKFPPSVYPVGRLDMDSEGLLFLSDDKRLTKALLEPVYGHEREYLVQVEGVPSEEELEELRNGVIIEGRMTLPAKARLMGDLEIPPRKPPIRERKNIPTTWVSITLTEGKYRQVRKMTAKIGHPTLRLIRTRIENILLGDLKIGETRLLTENEIKELYKKVLKV
jgi:23S rRNA pseudouridine2457 synthase